MFRNFLIVFLVLATTALITRSVDPVKDLEAQLLDEDAVTDSDEELHTVDHRGSSGGGRGGSGGRSGGKSAGSSGKKTTSGRNKPVKNTYDLEETAIFFVVIKSAGKYKCDVGIYNRKEFKSCPGVNTTTIDTNDKADAERKCHNKAIGYNVFIKVTKGRRKIIDCYEKEQDNDDNCNCSVMK